jgi:hypothetical protein
MILRAVLSGRKREGSTVERRPHYRHSSSSGVGTGFPLLPFNLAEAALDIDPHQLLGHKLPQPFGVSAARQMHAAR